MRRPALMRMPAALLIPLALAACDRPAQVCPYETTASADGNTRVALIVAGRVGPGANNGSAAVVSALQSLEFPLNNICSLSGDAATLENVRLAVSEFTSASNRNAIRFLSISVEGSVVVDDNGDEPDEYDETLLFADADGSGRGEIRDDELHAWLEKIQSRSRGSLVAVNAGIYSSLIDAEHNPMVRQDLDRSRNVGDGPSDGGDAASWLHDQNGPNHVVIAPGPGSAGPTFAGKIEELLHGMGVHTPTYAQLTQRFSFQMHAAGHTPNARGSGTDRVFDLHYTSLVPLSLGETTIALSIRADEARGGISGTDRERLTQLAVSLDGVSIASGEEPGEFEISRRDDGQYVLRGPGGRARNSFPNLDALPTFLAKHRLQKQLLKLRGNDSDVLPDYDTLEIVLRPNNQQLSCATAIWDDAADNEIQDIPLCYAWYVETTNRNDAVPLYLTLLLISSDGETIPVPGTGAPPLRGTQGFDAASQLIGAGPPIDVVDQVLAIGSTEPLNINSILRGTGSAPEGSRWTISTRPYRVVVNSAFLAGDEISQREYTIKNFDIRPYLPDDDLTSLSRFLRKADAMAKSSVTDGYSYEQHTWNKPTDEENLAVGIDCSRSIWFAFTRTGLPYNAGNGYLTTADMAAPNSKMAQEFDACELDEDYQLGDILVYRSDEEGDGHVVAVVDPEKRIAWGSHGWDGNVKKKLALEPDTGVEYQKIRVKQDWQRWDRSDMELTNCWRYRRFTEELADGRASSGSHVLEVTCQEAECRL